MKIFSYISVVFLCVALLSSCGFQPAIKPATDSSNSYNFPPYNKHLIQQNDNDSFKFIAVGHIHPIATQRGLPAFVDVLEKYVKAINREKPDVVFLLGDLALPYDNQNMWSILDNLFLKQIEAPIFAVGGNHDFVSIGSKDGIERWDTQSEKNIFLQYFSSPNNYAINNKVNFLLLSSVDEVDTLQNYIENALSKFSSKNPTILLIHQPLISKEKNGRKQVFSEEDAKMLKGEIDYILAGDFNPKLPWSDEALGVEQFRVGIGGRGRGQPLHFSIGTVADQNLTMQTREVSLPENHLWNFLRENISPCRCNRTDKTCFAEENECDAIFLQK